MRRFWSKFWKAGMAAAALVTLGGCSAQIATMEPLGQIGEAVDKEELEGTWLMGEESPIIVKFGKDGIGKGAGVDWSNEDFELLRFEFIPTNRTPRHHVLSMRGEEEPGKWEKKWYFYAYKFECPYLVIWTPDYLAFSDAEKSGRLQATHDGKDLVITSPGEAIVQVMKDQNSDWFEYTDPIVLRRVDPPCRGGVPGPPAEGTQKPGRDREPGDREAPSEKP